MWSGRADSRDVSAIRALAARESRHEERTASLLASHHARRLTVVCDSANRRLTELAVPALRTLDVAVGSHVPTMLMRRPPTQAPPLGGGLLQRQGDS